MSQRLFLHINLGSALSSTYDTAFWEVTLKIDDQSTYVFDKSDFIRIENGSHIINVFFRYTIGDREFITASGDQFVVENEDVHYTLNAYFLRDDSVELVRGNVGYDTEKGKIGNGCYIATAVYGSYNCPEVWTLRRFRDDILGKSWYGRLFIRFYYATSPTLVKIFGDKVWFKKAFKTPLDRLVKQLESNGVENTPYIDKDWRK